MWFSLVFIIEEWERREGEREYKCKKVYYWDSFFFDKLIVWFYIAFGEVFRGVKCRFYFLIIYG